MDNRKTNQLKVCPCRKDHGKIIYGDTSIGIYLIICIYLHIGYSEKERERERLQCVLLNHLHTRITE